MFAFVLGFAFLLLLLTFRSIVIPIKAIILNLLSIGAAYGILVLIFQDGRLESLVGFTSIGGVTMWRLSGAYRFGGDDRQAVVGIAIRYPGLFP